jgi:hypothetical protein
LSFLPSSHQKQLLVAVHASDIHNLRSSDAHTTTGASVLAAAALSGSDTAEVRAAVSAGAGDLEAAELVPIEKNVGQVVLQNDFQKVIAGSGDCPTILVVVIHDQTVSLGGIPELAVVVGVASGAILNAVNMVSLAEAMAYQEMGEPEAARESLQYYAGYLQKAYLDVPGLVERLDLIDPSPENYWSKTLPEINVRIHALPCVGDKLLIGGANDGTEDL